MIRRPGILVATVFALGALLGLATSAVFLDVDATEIRASAETNASTQAGPFADLFIDSLDQQDVFGNVADEVRADQMRNLLVATAAASVIAIGLGMAFSRRLSADPRRVPASPVGHDDDLTVGSRGAAGQLLRVSRRR